MLGKLLHLYRSQLAWQLILPQLLLTLALGLVGVMLVHYHTRNQMLDQLKARGAFMVDSIEHAASNAASIDTFGAYIEALGSARGVELILITGETPARVVAATDWAWVGRRLTTLPKEELRDDIELTLQTEKMHFDDGHDGGNIFDYTSPIDLMPLLPGKGVFVLHLDIRQDRRAAEEAARLLSVVLLVLIFGISTLQINAVRRRVLRPQAELLATMRANEAGQLVAAPVRGHDELAQLAGAYNQLIDVVSRKEAALRAADRAKTEFLSNLSHEIRTPLNGLLGITDLLAMDEPDPERLALIEQMRGAGIDLRGLLERILELAQLDMGRVQLSPQTTVLAEIIQGPVMRLRRTAQAKGLALKIDLAPDLPEAVSLDGKRLIQILNLLLDNAIKFSESGEICVTVRRLTSADLGETLEIDVADQGIGIPPDQMERVFESFVQGDGSATRKAGGNGLGLAIVKRLVNLMQGRIAILPDRGGGTILRLQLPLVLSDELE
ncbi:MAG: hypothetical protein IPH08_15125 [Rhodocyclaceae bacterium]|nr:hypothetical protein [Rhodocyclaceae bacterium]MBK6908334.1 hypothetical protein [Rhodocyclaceae bacterium]